MQTFTRDTLDGTGAQAPDPLADSYLERLESAAMAATFAASSDLPEARRKALFRLWLDGTFNAASHGIDVRHGCGAGLLVWEQAGATQHDLIYRAVTGINCNLGRAYRQPDGSWAALVIAGIGESLEEAQAAAEWAVSRLTAG
jgi:hypothetical protein